MTTRANLFPEMAFLARRAPGQECHFRSLIAEASKTHMIPKAKERQAFVVVLICLGLVALGITLGVIWTNMYAIR